MSKTVTWIRCGADFTDLDVLRWTEAVWLEPKRKTRKRKGTKAGERRVTAAVLTLDNRGYVRLSVIKDEIIDNKFGMPLKVLKQDEVITRKRATIERGNPERLRWPDETARPHAVSRFLR
jgi:hypothetical protein